MNKNGKIATVLIHIIFWCIFLSIPTVFNPRRFGQGAHKYIYDILELPRMANAILLIALFYFNTSVAIPRFYFKHRHIYLGTSIVLSVGIFYFVNYFTAPPEVRHLPTYTPIGNSFNLFMFLIVYAVSFTQCLYQQYHRIKEDRLNTRISFLTAQINPHFLFNTLNSIHSLSLVKSELVSDSIIRLSGIMRYSIGEGGRSKVEVGKEIGYIKDYMELQKLRLTEEVAVSLIVEDQFPHLEIAPFLLIPFVENAFKHGVNGEDDSEILIYIQTNQQSVDLLVQNTIVPTRSRPHGMGLGIETTKQRLMLLYPQRHKLTVGQSDNKFTVKLLLDLE